MICLGGGRLNKFVDYTLSRRKGTFSDYETFVNYLQLKSPLDGSIEGRIVFHNSTDDLNNSLSSSTIHWKCYLLNNLFLLAALFHIYWFYIINNFLPVEHIFCQFQKTTKWIVTIKFELNWFIFAVWKKSVNFEGNGPWMISNLKVKSKHIQDIVWSSLLILMWQNQILWYVT